MTNNELFPKLMKVTELREEINKQINKYINKTVDTSIFTQLQTKYKEKIMMADIEKDILHAEGQR